MTKVVRPVVTTRSGTDNERRLSPNRRWDSKRTTARNGGGRVCRGRMVKCAAGGGGGGECFGAGCRTRGASLAGITLALPPRSRTDNERGITPEPRWGGKQASGEMRRGRGGDGDCLGGAVPVDPSESKDCGRGAQSNYSTTLTPPLVPWVPARLVARLMEHAVVFHT